MSLLVDSGSRGKPVESQPRLAIRPCELRDANAFVAAHHRHHKPVHGHRWSLAVHESDGTMHGIGIVGRPVARKIDKSSVVEALRVATDGTPNACSAIYGAVCRQQRAHGYAKAITYILLSEPGTSLRAAGWVPVAVTEGGSWDRSSRHRTDPSRQTDPKIRWECSCTDLPPINLA